MSALPSKSGSADRNVRSTDPPTEVGAPHSLEGTPALHGLSFRRAFLIILVLAVGLRLFILLFMPLYPEQGILPGFNDEPLHLQYVKFVAAGGGWPVWRDSPDSLNYLNAEYQQPPAYYFIAAPCYRLGEFIMDGWGLYVTRLVSIIFGLVAGLFIHRAALLWFKDARIAAGAFAAGLLAPSAAIFSSLVSNDALVYCLAALVVHSLVLCRLGKGGAARELLTGLFIAAAVWTKMSGGTLIPLAWFAASPAMSVRRRWLARLRVLLVAVILISPLLVRQLIVYDQLFPTPLPKEFWPEQAVGVSGGAVFHPLPAIMTWLRLAAVPFMECWGSVFEKTVSMLWVAWWSGLFLTGGLMMLRQRPRDYMLIVAVLLVTAGFIWYNYEVYQVEFRLLMPAFPALAMIVAKGATSLRIPILVQGAIFCLPIVLLPFL